MAPFKASRLVYNLKPSKSRTENWTSDEKLFLIELCAERLDVIEDKRTDSTSVALKSRAWDEIHDEFERRFNDTHREKKRVKEQWKRLKVYARLEVQKQIRQKQELMDMNKLQQHHQHQQLMTSSGGSTSAAPSFDDSNSCYDNVQVKTELNDDGLVAPDDSTANGYVDGELSNPVVEKMLSVIPSLATSLLDASKTSAGNDLQACGAGQSVEPSVICDMDMLTQSSNDFSVAGEPALHEDTSLIAADSTASDHHHDVDELTNSREPEALEVVQRRPNPYQRQLGTTSRLAARSILKRRLIPSVSRNGTNSERIVSTGENIGTTNGANMGSTDSLDNILLRQERKLAMMEEEHCAKMEVIAIRKQVALLEKRLALRRLACMESS